MSSPSPAGQANGARPPYHQPADGHRPYGAHRFDVYSLKARRRLTLFGRGPLGLWVQLEADPTVVNLCERPLVVPDSSPHRVVDFWARGQGFDRLIFLIRGDDPISRAKREAQLAGFRIWAADAGCTIEERPALENANGQNFWLDNWIVMLQYCGSYASSLGQDYLERIGRLIDAPTSLGKLIEVAAHDGACDDPDIVRAAIYEFVRQGRARIPGLESARLHDGLVLEPR